jgi:gliding motility-associated-like protein
LKNLNVLLLLSLILLSQHSVFGQACMKAYDAETGDEISVFCVGQKVHFKSCNPNSQPDKEYYDFDKFSGGVQFPDTSKFFTYTAPGTYTVTQLINTGEPQQGERTFTVLPTPTPTFTATGCSQGNVKVTITDQNYDSFLVDFGGGITRTLPQGGSVSHQYAAGQVMKVVVTGKYSQASLPVCSNSAETTLQDLPLPPEPHLAKVTVDLPAPNSRITLTLEKLRPEYYYLIEKQSGTGFVAVDTIKNPAAAQMTWPLVQHTSGNQACFRIRVTDPCATALAIFSNTVCSFPVTATAGQGIGLSWPAYPDRARLTGYQLYKDGKHFQDLPGTQNSFKDEKVPCHQQICYQVIAILNNGAQSESQAPCLSTTTSPPPVRPFLTSTFTPDNQVLIGLQVPASQIISQVTYQKSVDGSGFSDLGISNTFTYQDNTFNKNQVFCYQAVYRDSCDQTSPGSNQTCPVFLKAAQQDNSTIMLTWSAYVGFSEPVQYVVQKMDANGQVLASIPVAGTSYTDTFSANSEQKVFYRIQGVVNGQEATYSNTERVAFEAKPLIPTAFTPNGDNLNDVFEVKGRFIQVTRFTIYDRWGQIIYQSQGQGWDGKINGKLAPTGTYPYSVSWKEENGLINTKNGIVSLLR